MVVTGDFFQLPPVTKGNGQVKFAFEASMWKETIKHTYNLTKVFRQSDQGSFILPCVPRILILYFYLEFVDMLNEMRFGRLSQKSIARFKSLSRPIQYDDGLAATELYHPIPCMRVFQG